MEQRSFAREANARKPGVRVILTAQQALVSFSTPATDSMSDKDVLISMGFDPARVECTCLGNDPARI